MIIRQYTEADDPGLMALERQCPRGAPEPFVHYRRRFVDRAALFSEYFLWLIESQGEVVAVAASGIKDTQVDGQARRVAYIFDVRVAPKMRRQGLAATLLESLEEELIKLECEGAYAHIVATNVPSLRLFAGLGYERRRQIRFLTYQPMPLFLDDPIPVRRHPEPHWPNVIEHYQPYDMFVADVSQALAPFGFERWESEDGRASISLFDQSQVFQQVAADGPWPTPEEMSRRGRHWRLFDPLGDAASLEALFNTIRDQSVSENINKLTMLIDAQEPIPSFFFAETSNQREYIVVTRSFTEGWDGLLGARFYADTREL